MAFSRPSGILAHVDRARNHNAFSTCHRDELIVLADKGCLTSTVAPSPRTRPAWDVYVSTWSRWVYVAFVIDAYARRILGWRTSTSMSTSLFLDALEQAVWTRNRCGTTDLTRLVQHTDAGSQYTSITYTERLAAAGIDASIGTVGDSYDTQSTIVGEGVVSELARHTSALRCGIRVA